MRILPDLPDLRILPTDTLRPHEHEDESRGRHLRQALLRDGVLRNPPIVLQLGGQEERYVVLDGANRTTAFRTLGIEHVLAQVVHPGDTRVEIETWNHAVLGATGAELESAARSVTGVQLRQVEVEEAEAGLARGECLAFLSGKGDRALTVVADASHTRERVDGLNRLVGAYLPRGTVQRTNARRYQEVETAFADLAGLVVFLPFRVQDVVEAVSQGLLLPGGLTRFIVSPRALRVNYPIEELRAPGGRALKEQRLAAWLKERVAQQKVRYYAEATYLFDE